MNETHEAQVLRLTAERDALQKRIDEIVKEFDEILKTDTLKLSIDDLRKRVSKLEAVVRQPSKPI